MSDSDDKENHCIYEDIEMPDDENFNPLVFEMLAFNFGLWAPAIDNDVERVKLLLDEGDDPSCVDRLGFTALHYAAKLGHYDVSKLLVERGTDVNLQGLYGQTALLRAVMEAKVPIVKLLLSHGASPFLADGDGQTPLHKAAAQGDLAVANLLVNRFENLKDYKDKHGKEALFYVPDGQSQLKELLNVDEPDH